MPYAVLLYILNAGWQVALVAAAAFLLSRLLKLAPEAHCWLWMAAFGLAALAPVWAGLAGIGPVQENGPSGLTSVFWFHIRHGVVLSPGVAQLLVAAFWASLGFAVVRLLAGGFVAHRLVASSAIYPLPGALQDSLDAVCRDRGRKLPDIRVSARIASPLVAGLWRPCILVPPGILDQHPDRLRAALLHELAHVMRRDHLSNIAIEVLALPLAWHPALHAIKAMIRLTREQACDAAAADQIGCRHRYAQSLLSLARQAVAPKNTTGAALGMFGGSDLKSRIALLASTAGHRRLAGPIKVAAAASFVLLGVLMTMVHVAPVLSASPPPPRLARAMPVYRTLAMQSVPAMMVAPPAVQEHHPRKRENHGVRPADQFAHLHRVTQPIVSTNLYPMISLMPFPGGGSDDVLDFTPPRSALRYQTIVR